ncbi:universal stress protein [Desulfosporosinus youngiae]|uniref:Universal stress protein UspA-like protein n=1 Tax=Desulfosporosinus youngiae DSM 17734 TaxID=768710 RepID=H5Y388_9FIRM|nr:universal stress protein [Desulfosporosinus youngiae]EHQ88857.1 universal stress protein UspA-like protein [Desulfosporosinus youngiae DSM 17734]
MNGAKFNVLLYSDESRSASFALAYTAMLMTNMPNMSLAVVTIKESNRGSNTETINQDSWPVSHQSERMKIILDILSARKADIHHQVIYCNPNIPDTANALLEYARKKSIDLIVIGAGDVGTLKGLIFGSLAHTLQKKSPIPVLQVKNVSEDFLERYKSKPSQALRLLEIDKQNGDC